MEQKKQIGYEMSGPGEKGSLSGGNARVPGLNASASKNFRFSPMKKWGVLPLSVFAIFLSCAPMETKNQHATDQKSLTVSQKKVPISSKRTLAGNSNGAPSDKKISAAVYDLITLAGFSPLSVNVKSRNGHVALSGHLSGMEKKDHLLNAIEKIKGIRSVEDRLTVAAVSEEPQRAGGTWDFLLSLLALPLLLALVPVILLITYAEIRLAQRARKVSRKEAADANVEDLRQAS